VQRQRCLRGHHASACSLYSKARRYILVFFPQLGSASSGLPRPFSGSQSGNGAPQPEDLGGELIVVNIDDKNLPELTSCALALTSALYSCDLRLDP